MQQIILSEKLTLSFEPRGKKVRLIISEADEELVCRQETLRKLGDFVAVEQLHIFRGRLQLKKNNDIIEIIMNHKPIAIVSANNFKETLNRLQ